MWCVDPILLFFQKQPPEVFLEISQNSQENICAKPATLLEKSLWHRCFSVNFAKFPRTPLSWNTSGQLILFFVAFFDFTFRLEKHSSKKCEMVCSNSNFSEVPERRIDSRSTRPEVFLEICCSENFGKLPGKHVWWCSLFAKLQVFRKLYQECFP